MIQKRLFPGAWSILLGPQRGHRSAQDNPAWSPRGHPSDAHSEARRPGSSGKAECVFPCPREGPHLGTGPSPGRVTLGMCGIFIFKTTCLQGRKEARAERNLRGAGPPCPRPQGPRCVGPAFLVSPVPEGSPGHTGVPGVIVDAGWCPPGRMGSGVLGVSRDMFSLLPSHLVMEPQVECPGPRRGMSKAQPGNISQTPSRTGGSPGPSAAGSAWTSV